MHTTNFFEQLLGLSSPYKVVSVVHNVVDSREEVDIIIEIEEGYVPVEGAKIHDYEDRVWRHLDLFQYSCHIHCRVPKYKYPKGSGVNVRTLGVPWAGKGSSFTLQFEEMAINLVKLYGVVSKVAVQLGIYPQRLWTIIRNYARKESHLLVDMSKVRRIGMDETSKRKGHDYVTCFLDMDTGDLLMVLEGKDSSVVEEFVKKASKQGLVKESVTDVSSDMSAAFKAGVDVNLPNAEVTYDKFHVAQLVQRAFECVRKSVARKSGEKFGKWIFLNPPERLSSEEKEELDGLLQAHPVLDMAYEMKNSFKLIWEQPSKELASAYLSFWADFIGTLKQNALTRLAKSLDRYHQGIIRYFDTGLTNGLLEGFNSKIQTMKRNARGYKNPETLKLMIRWHCALKRKPTT